MARTKRSPLILSWGNIYDGYGSRNLAYHILQTGQRELVLELQIAAQWDVITFWEIKDLDQQDKRSLYSKIDFLLSRSSSIAQKAVEEKQLEANTYLANGIFAALQGELKKSLQFLREALSKNMEIKNTNKVFEILLLLGGIHLELGESDASMMYCRNAIRLAIENNDTYGSALSYYILGVLLASTGDLLSSNSYLLEAQKLIDGVSIDLRVSKLYLRLSKVTLAISEQLARTSNDEKHLEHLKKAETYITQGVGFARKYGEKNLIIQFNLELIRLHIFIAKHSLAREKLPELLLKEEIQQARKLARMSKDGYYYLSSMYMLAQCYDICGNHDMALKTIKGALNSLGIKTYLEDFFRINDNISSDKDWGSIARLYLLRGSVLAHEYLTTKEIFLIKEIADSFFAVFQLIPLLRSSYFISITLKDAVFREFSKWNYNDLKQLMVELEELNERHKNKLGDLKSYDSYQRLSEFLEISLLLRDTN